MLHRRVLVALIAAAAFSAPIFYNLMSAPTVDRSETQMLYSSLQNTLPEMSVPFVRIAPWGANERVHEMSLSTPLPMDVMRHAEIGILFYLTNKSEPHPSFGRLEFAGSDCVYETPPESQVSSGAITYFIRGDKCVPTNSRPTGEITLTVRMAGPGDLGVFTRVLPPQYATSPDVRADGLIYVADRHPAVPDTPPLVLGSFVDDYGDRGTRRGHLLAYMWTHQRAMWPVMTALAACTLLMVVGLLLFPTDHLNGSWSASARAGGAAFCLAAALALGYGFVVPPLHAADETAFARSYGEFTNQPRLLPEFQQIARENHFERIKAAQFERFRVRDIGAPLDYVHKFEPLIMPTRSSTSSRLWSLIADLTRGLDARRLFALVRLVHVLIFGLAVGVATALLVALTEVRYAQLLCFPFFIIPTLPFFGMQFSETALLTAAAVLLAASIVVITLDGRRSHWAGFPFALGAAGLWLSTRSSLPMAVLVGTVAVGRVLMARKTDRPVFAAIVFWGGAMLAALSFFSIATVDHLTRIMEMAATSNARLADNGIVVPEWILFNPWFVILLLVSMGAAAELSMATLRDYLPRSPLLDRAAPVVAYGTAAGIGASLIASWWIDFPDVQNIQSPIGPDTRAYTWQVLAGMVTMFRLRSSSTFLSDSVWAGFGWLDTIPSDTYVAILVTLTGASLSWLLIRIGRTRSLRATAWLACLGVGALLTLVGYAFAAKQVKTNLHGRFLLPWFVAMVALAWISPSLEPLASKQTSGRLRFALLLAIAVAFHSYSLWFNLNRYF